VRLRYGDQADWNEWCNDDLRRYFDIVLGAFGADRLMLGSDWPILTLAADYRTWVTSAEAITDRFSDDEREKFWSRTAVKVFGLNQKSP
jgi:L-fucono-1,5-lactonase